MLREILATAIKPAFDLLPPQMTSDRATVMLLAIGLQESRLTHRRQIGGPARGLLQFEQKGGTLGVLRHPASALHAKAVCAARGVTPVSLKVYNAFETDDVLNMAFGRLLLWTDPRALPSLGDANAAWDLYLRTWRPGKPHRHTWDKFYSQAVEFVCSQRG